MILEHISYDRIIGLLDICRSSSVKTLSFIRLKYENDFSFFDDVVLFAELVGLIKIEQNNLSVCVDSGKESSAIEIALCNESSIFPSFNDFLNKFMFKDNSLEFVPSRSDLVKYSNERRILKGIGTLEISDDTYIIKNKSIVLKRKNKQLSLDQLKQKIKQDEINGEAAEKYVLQYELEQQKIYGDTIKEFDILHISPINVSAGYDIESFDKNAAKNKVFTKIYIEVKNVSAGNLKFFWSRKEINIAKEYQQQYFLYLVKNINKCDNEYAKNIVMIQDPYKQVFCNALWNQENETISFWIGERNNEQ